MTTGAIPAARPLIGTEERAAVERVLASGMLVQGPEVAAFEHEFADLVAGHTCVAVNSGTSALHLGLLALGIGPGDEVIVPSFTFAATANSVALAGATPVFADIDPQTYCLDPAAVEAAVSERTAAIMPVHLYGHPAQMSALQEVADRHGLAIVEDACQAHLARWRDRPVGAFGAVAAFSFYPTKNMTTGEGGMVVCAGEDVARKLRLLRNQGMERQYENELVGFNARMTDMAAAIGRVQLTKVRGWTAQRRQNAAYLDAQLAELTPNVVTPTVADRSRARLPPVHRPRDRSRPVARPTDRRRGRQRDLLSDPHAPAAVLRHRSRAGRRPATDRTGLPGGPVAAGPPGPVRGRPGADRGRRDEGCGGVR